jgi:hypothetical protein
MLTPQYGCSMEIERGQQGWRKRRRWAGFPATEPYCRMFVEGSMRQVALAIGIYVMAITGISVSTAGAWWDDSHGYQGLRAYGCGPPCGGGYFSGVKVRVSEGHYHRYHRGKASQLPPAALL